MVGYYVSISNAYNSGRSLSWIKTNWISLWRDDWISLFVDYYRRNTYLLSEIINVFCKVFDAHTFTLLLLPFRDKEVNGKLNYLDFYTLSFIIVRYHNVNYYSYTALSRFRCIILFSLDSSSLSLTTSGNSLHSFYHWLFHYNSQ